MKTKSLIVLLAAVLLLPALVSAQEIRNVRVNWMIRGQITYPSGAKAILYPKDAFILKNRKQLTEYLPQYPDIVKIIDKVPSKSFVVELGKFPEGAFPSAGQFEATVSFWEPAEDDESIKDSTEQNGDNEKGWEEPSPRNIPEDFEPPVIDEEPDPDEPPEDMSQYAKEGEDSKLYIVDSQTDNLRKKSRLVIVADLDFPKWNQISIRCGEHLLELHYGVGN